MPLVCHPQPATALTRGTSTEPEFIPQVQLRLEAHPGGIKEKDLRSVPGYDSPRLAQ